MSSTGAIGAGQPLPFPDGDVSTGTSSGVAPGRFAGNAELAQVASGNATLERGARGPHATLVQEALIGVGYEMPRWGADGSFGAETETAVLAFQRDAGLAETGAIDAETLECLAASAEGLQPRGPFVGNAELRQVALGAATLANGSRGESARLVQQALADAGFDPQGVDGWIGQNTLAAVADLQQQAGLPQTGTVDAATLTALEARIGQAPIDEPEPTDGVTPGTTTPGSAAAGVQNPRFSDPVFAAVAAGRRTLGRGAGGPAVEEAQRALMDLGFNLPVYGIDGDYGGEMATAVGRFQREMGLEQTGVINAETIDALDRVAPPPGQALERNPDYAAIFADGRADMTIAIGFDERGAAPGKQRSILRNLSDQGFRAIDDPMALPADERERLGLTDDRVTEGALYFHREGPCPGDPSRTVDFVVRVVTPPAIDGPDAAGGGAGAEAAAQFRRALEQDEVVMYTGHARYGTGPDFNHAAAGDGNVVINEDGYHSDSSTRAQLYDALRGRDSDLPQIGSPGKYQLVYFQGCSTENYLDPIRDRMPGRDNANTDIIATTIATKTASGAGHINNFMNGFLGGDSFNRIEETNNNYEVGWNERFDVPEDELAASRGTILGNGFLGNEGNRLIPSPNSTGSPT